MSFSLFPIGILICGRNVRIRQPGAYSRPCDLEPDLAILKVDAGPAVAAERRFAVDVAAPPPLRSMGWDTTAFHDPADGQAAPDHLIVVRGGAGRRSRWRVWSSAILSHGQGLHRPIIDCVIND